MVILGSILSVLIGIALGLFGGGGSILAVPLLVYVLALDAKVAIAAAMVVVGAASSVAAVQRWRQGDIDPRAALPFGAAGMVTAYAGGRAAQFLDAALLMLMFAVMMAITALAMWRGRRAAAPAPHARSPQRLALQGGIVGIFTGLLGVGGGFLIVPALSLWAGLPLQQAIGTSLVIIVLNCAAGFLGYATHVDVPWSLVVIVTAAAVLGSVLGTLIARRVEPARMRRGFAMFVLLMAIVILVREANLWVSDALAALPRTGPQLAFALVMLAIGIAAGRSSRSKDPQPGSAEYSDGAGI